VYSCERPNDLRNFPASGPWVCLTDAPTVHHTICERAKSEDWFVFRVKPATKIYSGECLDLVCKRAQVLACVGFASDYPVRASVPAPAAKERVKTTWVGSWPSYVRSK
jgi:hypothetical protein